MSVSAVTRVVLSGPRAFLDWVHRTFILTDRKYYYGDFFASDARWLVAVKNVLRPMRFLKKLIYRQVLPLPYAVTFAVPLDEETVAAEDASVDRVVEELRTNGIVVLSGHYKEIAEHIARKFDIKKENYPPMSGYSRAWVNPTQDSAIFAYFVDRFLLTVIARYYQCQPYFRHLPNLNITYSCKSTRDVVYEKADFASRWHFDTPNLVSAQLKLTDVTGTDTRMLYASGSHRVHRVNVFPNDNFYSEEYVRDHYEVYECIGEKGALTIFDNNGLHRAELVKDSFRAQFESYFTPGNSLSTFEQMRESARLEGWSAAPDTFDSFNCLEAPLVPLQRSALKALEGRK